MKDINTLLSDLRDLMTADDCPVAGPVDAATLAELINNAPPADWDFHKRSVYEDIRLLLINRKDYAEMFSLMDGAEYNGMTLYNLVQSANNEPLWSNIYVRNIEARDNEIFIDPHLTDKVLIGEDGTSVFLYNAVQDCFEIRDRVATDYVTEAHHQFSDFLSAVMDTVA
ncbi:hypothetical protein C7431_11122 [Pantoea allii]|uniref:SUKH superfamily protein n=1 Tax=Pantoea allii TaxID=574096 RepID=A0A2V2B4Y4_9GAMM|nr:YrhA family protein [Pantoea allii]PWK94287.1 hypothetical protein C7431_11122 [Pantoea allii]